MVYSPRSARHGALLVGTVAVLGLLTACGDDSGAHSAGPATVSGTAAPVRDTPTAPQSVTATSPAGTSSAPAPKATGSPGSPAASAPPASTAPAAASTRCHTSELRASVGRNDPGAGQENFPVVLTNTSARSCTVRGYPGAAFVNGSGTQLGPDPKREPGSPVTVTLRPGQSAWAGLTFSNPEISGAKTARPAALLVTPPDERDPLKAAWSGGPVPVAGNSSAVRLTVLSPGTGP